MSRLVYIGSPLFDGIDLLNLAAQKHCNEGLVLLDGITPNRYPTIKNFSFSSWILWTTWRRRQFLSTLPKGSYTYSRLSDAPKTTDRPEPLYLDQVLNQTLNDHCICNNFTEAKSAVYKSKRSDAVRSSLNAIDHHLRKLLRHHNIRSITIFNGRNPVALLLANIAKQLDITITWMEFFGKRNGTGTYLESPVDIFDFDQLSDHILARYNDDTSPDKEKIASNCLDDRISHGDPFLVKWGVDFQSKVDVTSTENGKLNVCFLFSSEDEYPAFKPSKHGFNPPTNQYDIFIDICREILSRDVASKVKIAIKLHPRYAVETKKLNAAANRWSEAIAKAHDLGIDLQVIKPLTSAYSLIKASDLVFSFGSTAWEATYLGKTAVLLGPNCFASHDCAYIASSAKEVVNIIESPPPAKPRQNCYPYAWAWHQLGVEYFPAEPKVRNKFLKRFLSPLLNRFTRHEA